MAGIWLIVFSHAGGLPCLKVFDPLGTDAELYKIYGVVQGSTPDVVVSVPLYAESRPLAIDLARPDRLV